MDRFILSLKKRVLLPTVFALGLVVWFVLCQAHYVSYWEGTIYRVQTVDFNLLHHTLPPTLSQLVIAGRDDLIQKVLDSTYGLFGVVVTDPSGQAVLYRTNKVYHRQSWQNLVAPEYLNRQTEPYDLITDPPPLTPFHEHKSPRASAASPVLTKPMGRVLGRIYYVRSPPPSFLEDITGFLTTGFLELSGAKRGYLFITLSTAGFSLVFVLLVLLRRRGLELRQKELEHRERELEIKQKALDHLTAELLAQQARKEWLEKEADLAYRRALGLKSALERLRDSLAVVDMHSQGGERMPAGPGIKMRPPVHPPSTLIGEIESLIPELTNNAQTLKSQALQLQDVCALLEHRQDEMRKILDQAYLQATTLPSNVLRFKAK